MYRRINDQTINTPRCGKACSNAIRNAARLSREEIVPYGHVVDRVLLVHVDDKKHADYLACIVFSLDNQHTLVAYVDGDGNITDKCLYGIRTAKRLPREFMYGLVGQKCEDYALDPNWEQYHIRVYARNLSCYV